MTLPRSFHALHTAPWAWLAACALALGCNGRLAISDEPAGPVAEGTGPEGAGSNGVESDDAAGTGVDDTAALGAGAACQCSSSAQLMALGCEARPDVSTGPQSFLSDDGQTFVFSMCYGDARLPSACTTFRWWNEIARDSFPKSRPQGLTADGRSLLLYMGANQGFQVIGVDGVQRDTAMARAHMASNGKVIGTIPTTWGDGGVGQSLLRWSPPGSSEPKFNPFGLLPAVGDDQWTIADVSEDGNVVAAYAIDPGKGPVPIVWQWEQGVREPGTLPAGATGLLPVTVSRDGSTIAGFTTDATNVIDIFSWTADGLQIVAPAVPVAFRSDVGVLRLSADGRLVAGTTTRNGSSQAFVGGRAGLSYLEGHGALTDMTPDGSMLVGSTDGEGFTWVPGDDGFVVSTPGWLSSGGVEHDGWELGPPTNVSSDGRVLFGRGTCGGVPTYYRWALQR